MQNTKCNTIQPTGTKVPRLLKYSSLPLVHQKSELDHTLLLTFPTTDCVVPQHFEVTRHKLRMPGVCFLPKDHRNLAINIKREGDPMFA